MARKRWRCPKCAKPRTKEGHDPCIANLPGVAYACCGHGRGSGYVKFDNGMTIRMTLIEVTLDDPTATHLPWVRTDLPK